MNIAVLRLVKGVIEEIRRTVTRPWTLMEICGGQTHAIVRHGIDQLLPPEIELVHGPGCPVCVTPLELIDKALAIASQPNVIFCSYGDMLRVPGSGRTCSRSRRKAEMCAWSIRRWMQLHLRRKTLTNRLYFLRLALKRPRRRM